MIVTKVRRVVGNPHKRRKPTSRRNRSTGRRRRLSDKQVRIFGTKAQKAALKRRNRSRRAKANPSRKARTVSRRRATRTTTVHRKRVVRRRRTAARSNPAHIVTLGYLNPQRKRRTPTVAKRKAVRRRRRSVAVNVRRRRRYANPARRVRRAHRRNSTKIIVVGRRRRRNPLMRVRRVHHRRHAGRRNPQFFGAHVTPMKMVKYVAGGLVGVAATKAIMPMLPSALTGSATMLTISTAAVAFATGWAATKVSPEFGSAVLFGGLMQAASVALNSFLPSAGGFLALQGGRGVGALVPGAFTIPENPVMLGNPGGIAVGSPMARAYKSAY